MSLSEERLDEIRDSLGRELGMWTNDSQAAADLLAEVKRLRAGIKALHRPALPVFSWQSGLRFDEPCPECHGKAGVHSCGCWSDEDAEFVCFECSRPSSGYLRRDIPWPCETAALLNPPTEGETDHG